MYSDVPAPATQGDTVLMKSDVIAAMSLTLVGGKNPFLRDRGPHTVQEVHLERDGRWSYVLDLGEGSWDYRFLADKFQRIEVDLDAEIKPVMTGSQPRIHVGS